MSAERWQILPHAIGKPRPSAGVAGDTLRSRADAGEAAARLAVAGWSYFTIERHTRGDAERWTVEADAPRSGGRVWFSLMPFAGALRTRP